MIHQKPKASVIMCIYKEPINFIEESVKSILQQTYKCFELIIVIDNPSHTKAIDLIQKLSEYDSRIKLIINKSNYGLAFSLNKAIKLANGTYIVRMDSDDISFPTRLEKQIQFMERHPDVALSGTSVIYIDEAGKEIEVKKQPLTLSGIKAKFLLGKTPCFHPTWIFRKDIIKEIGGYRLLPTSQDYDFIGRLLFRKFKLANIKEPLLKYRIHPRSITTQKNLYQFLLSQYIRKAFLQKYILDDRMFSPSKIEEILSTPHWLKSIHTISMYFLQEGKLISRKNPPLSLLLIAFSLISPYQIISFTRFLSSKLWI